MHAHQCTAPLCLDKFALGVGSKKFFFSQYIDVELFSNLHEWRHDVKKKKKKSKQIGHFNYDP